MILGMKLTQHRPESFAGEDAVDILLAGLRAGEELRLIAFGKNIIK